jgi:FixJ family two-component response regulator
VSAETPLVCVVDDDASVRRSLSRLLRATGYDVAAFESAAEYLASESVDTADCLIVDVRMPGLTGIELQRALAARRSVPLIFITGHGDIAMAVNAMKAGAVDFLAKPFEPELLLEAVRNALLDRPAT